MDHLSPLEINSTTEFDVNKIKDLSNLDLIHRFGRLVQTERKITQLVLECILEIDRRKIYLEKAYPSLFDFLVKEFGYSPSSAMRRIESARLLREIPEVSEKIQSGAINLSQLSKLQQTIRAVQKTSNHKIMTAHKKEILNKIEFTNQAKTELILAQEFNLPLQSTLIEKQQIHKDESITLTITFTKKQIELLEKAQNLISHSVPDKKWADMFTYLAEKEIKSRSPKSNLNIKAKPLNPILPDQIQTEKTKTQHQHANSIRKSNDQDTTNQLKIKYSKIYLDQKSRKLILDPQTSCCQFQDPISKKICGSQKFLQVDHIQPRWAGGTNDLNNFQSLCAQHNQYKYKIQSGLLPLR